MNMESTPPWVTWTPSASGTVGVISQKAVASATCRILFVDDERRVLDSIRRVLGTAEPTWSLRFAESVSEAKRVLNAEPVDVVVTDLTMPCETGFDLLRFIRRSPNLSRIPVIVLTGLGDADLKRRALDGGAIDLLNKPISHDDLIARLRSVLQLKRYEDELSHLNATLESKVAERTRELETSRTDILLCLAMAGECRDRETGRHLIRVARFTRLLAEAIGLPAEETLALFRASPLHDIGKLGIPDAILLKPGLLTAQERIVMQTHCEIGHRILTAPAAIAAAFDEHTPAGLEAAADRAPNPLLALAAEIALSHHERWDGMGYPRKLRGEEIPLSARIVSVADVYDALTTQRSYKPARSAEDARRVIQGAAGTFLDPALVEKFTSIRREFEKVAVALTEPLRPNDAHEPPRSAVVASLVNAPPDGSQNGNYNNPCAGTDR
jgi:putative two-component system response regulator